MKTQLLLFLALAMPIFGWQQVKEEKSEQWISVGSDAVADIQAAFEDRAWPVKLRRSKTKTEVSFMEVNEEQMVVISRLLHEKFKRCGGFHIHDSLDQANRSLQKSNLVSELALEYTLDRASEVNTVLNDLTEQGIVDVITGLTSFSTRYYTSQESVDAANWLKAQWEGMAAGRSDITVELYNHSWLMPSVVMTITGAHQPQDIVVMGGHLDSINQSSGNAPGADDDASGIATLTEILRAALSNGYTPARTIKVIGYAAEEVGLRGSGDIASAAAAAGDNVIGVLQLDMTNYNGSVDDIYLMTDYTDSGQNTFLGNLIDTYTGATWSTDTCGYGCSDHASWHNNGFRASMPFEAKMNEYNPNIHTANDTINVSGGGAIHALKFARLGVSYLIELGKGGINGNPGTDPGPVGNGPGNQGTEITNGQVLSNLSGASGAQDRYFINVPAGATNLQIATSGGSGDCDLYTKFASPPTTSSYDCRPYASGNNESCPVANPSEGTYYIMLNGYSSYSGMSLSVSYDTSSGQNQAPTASFSSSTNTLTASFTSTSSDSDGSISAHAWNFGDGSTSTATNPSHTYSAAGTYTVTLTVTDNDGATDTATASVTVSAGTGWVTILNNDFESGWNGWSDGGSDCRLSANDAAYAHGGSNCVRIRDNSGTHSSFSSPTMNLSSYSEVEIDFWFYALSMENGEDFFVEFFDGSSWQTIGNYVRGTDFSNNAFGNPVISINSSSYNFNSSNQIRIRCDASANNDAIYVDDIIISGN